MQSLETLTERDFDSVWEIMEESFPRDERRSREAQRKILDVSWYHLYGYRAHGELMAFLAVWEFDTFTFVDYFAVKQSCRNGGLGAALLTQLTAQRRKPVMNPYEYMQPAMGEDRHAIPLRIMSYPKRLLVDEFETVRDVLYCHVYRQK